MVTAMTTDSATARAAAAATAVATEPTCGDRLALALEPCRYTVFGRVRETRSSVTLTLAPADADRVVAPGQPGQFNMLWAFGVGEVPISLSGADNSGLLVHTIRAVGPVSSKLCSARPGDTVGVRGPFGSTWPIAQALGQDVIVVGGGIGLAPVRPVIHAILADRSSYGEVTLVVGARKARDLLFRTELDRWWRERTIRVRTIVDEPTPDWKGNIGVVTKELSRIRLDPGRTIAIACGPEIMMKFVAHSLVDKGVDTDRIAVSMERNMQCGIGQCGHCQIRGYFACTDGPVFAWREVEPLIAVREL